MLFNQSTLRFSALRPLRQISINCRVAAHARAPHRTQKMQFRARPTNFPGFLYVCIIETRRTVIYDWSTLYSVHLLSIGLSPIYLLWASIVSAGSPPRNLAPQDVQSIKLPNNHRKEGMPNPTPNDEIIFASHLNRSSLALGTPLLVCASFTATESGRVETNPSLLAGHTQYVYASHVRYHVPCMYFYVLCTYVPTPVHT